MNKATKEKVYTVLGNVLGVTITDDLAMNDVPSWDSLRHGQMLAKLEEVFGIEISFQDTLRMISVRSIRDVLEKYIDDK